VRTSVRSRDKYLDQLLYICHLPPFTHTDSGRVCPHAAVLERERERERERESVWYNVLDVSSFEFGESKLCLQKRIVNKLYLGI
jgi:hypothetical protein